MDSDESLAKDELKKIEARDVDRNDFDLDHERAPITRERDGKSAPFTFAEWADKYPTFDDVKRKKSLSTDLLLIKLHLRPFFGAMLLTEISREALTRCTPWMSRLAEFADETCLSQGDLLRVTEDMIDAKTGIIRLNHGGARQGVEQVSRLTSRCRQIVAEIEADLKQSNVRNVHGPVFTIPNGSPITKGKLSIKPKRP